MIVCRKKPLSPEHASGRQRLTRAQFLASHGADPAAVRLVRAFARDYGLKADPRTPARGRRTVKVTGTVAQMQRAFGVSLMSKNLNGETYRCREGSIQIPESLEGYVVAVLGLDNRPQAVPHFRVVGDQAAAETAQGSGFARPHAANGAFTPIQVGQLYGFPANASAAGQTIGIIELGGGFRHADLTAYFKSLGLKTPKVTAVSVSGGKNSPSTANSADGEVMLDIEVAAAVAPGARIAVYFAPNTDQGFIDAVGHAIHDTANKPSIISISWGAAEIGWTRQAMNVLDAACQSAAALGITITAASGDSGSSDGISDGANHVDFPASSPHVLACGGTRLQGSGSTITSETVWNEQAQGGGASGGGVSDVFALPDWQRGAHVPSPPNGTGGRGVPDVAGDADPSTGYTIRVDGQTMTIGGTSAVAPLWAGLIALANQQNGVSAGFINPAIYKNPAAFHDITATNNGAFSAGPGWDACTGLGSPIAPVVITTVKPSTSTTSAKKKKHTTTAKSKTAKRRAA